MTIITLFILYKKYTVKKGLKSLEISHLTCLLLSMHPPFRGCVGAPNVCTYNYSLLLHNYIKVHIYTLAFYCCSVHLIHAQIVKSTAKTPLRQVKWVACNLGIFNE